MNSTGCPNLWATDEVFRFNTPLACDVPVLAYYAFGGVICVCKAIVAYRQTNRWCRRRRQQHDAIKAGIHRGRNGGKKSSIPYQPINSITFALFNLLFFLLTAIGVIYFTNGLSLSVYTACYLPFAWMYTFALFRVVSLGERLLPKTQQGTDIGKNLGSFDFFGKTMVVFQLLSLVISSVTLIILGPIYPQYEILFLQIGFAFKAGFTASCGFGFCYQYERLVRAMQTVTTKVQNAKTPGDWERSLRDDIVHQAIMKMRHNQVLQIAINFPSVFLLTFLATNTFPAYIWLVIFPPLIESVATLLHELYLGAGSNASGRRTNKTVSTGATGQVAVLAGLGIIPDTGSKGSRVSKESKEYAIPDARSKGGGSRASKD